MESMQIVWAKCNPPPVLDSPTGDFIPIEEIKGAFISI